jgi:exopolysaccharide biosynthesis polyprenyl glycosylphosphotransferase
MKRCLMAAVCVAALTTSAHAGDPLPSVELQRAPLARPETLAKRACNIALALIALVLLAPLMLLTALAVKLDSAGPVIFRQRRAGFDGQAFSIYKFRTMSVLEDGPRIAQTRRNDPRVTRIGRLLRQSSIDELPQLFNVLRADMALVGPRPHALAHDDQYRALISSYALRHQVKPGITGWAQVNGQRGETENREDAGNRVRLDLWYIDNWSLTLDFRILWRACFEVMRQEAL